MNEHLPPRWAAWAAAVATLPVVLAGFSLAGLSLELTTSRSVAFIAAIAALCLICKPAEDSWRRKALDCAEHLAIFASLCLLGALAAYPIAALTRGYADAAMASFDAALGFDWVALYRLTEGSGALRLAGRMAYLTIFASPILILILLSWSGRVAHVRRFLLAFWIALALTMLLFALFPVASPLVHHLGGGFGYMPVVGVDEAQTIEALRAGVVTSVRLDEPHGLINFPSFHAASAVLFAWAAWPDRRLRWPMLAINLAMLAATPIEGTHYLADTIGGALVALVAIRAAGALGKALSGLAGGRLAAGAPAPASVAS